MKEEEDFKVLEVISEQGESSSSDEDQKSESVDSQAKESTPSGSE